MEKTSYVDVILGTMLVKIKHDGFLGFWDYQGDSLQRVGQNIFDFRLANLTLLDDEKLAIGGAKGVYILNLKDFYQEGKITVKTYNHNNGYLGIEATQNCTFVDSKNQFWVPSATGVSYIPIEDIIFEKPVYTVKITEVGKEKLGFQWDEKYRLPFGENSLHIHYEGIGFGRPMHTQYAFQLEGVDEKFTEWTENRSALYAGLAPGTYQFSVKSRNPDEQDFNLHPSDSIQIVISMPFWKHPELYKWAIPGILLAIFGLLIALLLANNFYQQKKQREILNRTLEKRSKQLETLLKDLRHRTNGQFNTTAYYLNKKRRLEKGSDVSDALQEAENLIYSLSTINKHLSADKETSLQNSIREITENMQFEAKTMINKELELDVSIPKMDIKPSDALYFGTMITELMTNSIKYAFDKEPNPKTSITIEKTDKKGISLIYQDNGIGHKKHQVTSGKGMQIINDIIEQLNGSYTVNTSDGFNFSAIFPNITA
ncbi:MAG: hypothetical protein GY705_14150 [Bacteroidetes bacterium]|nr:hypothetical protein [Bacteroidota bacterium]